MIHENTEPALCSVDMNGLVVQYKFADDMVPWTNPSDRYASATKSNSITTDSSRTILYVTIMLLSADENNMSSFRFPNNPSSPGIALDLHCILLVIYLYFFSKVCCLYHLIEPFNSHSSTQFYLVRYCIYKTTAEFPKNNLKSVCYWFAMVVCLIQ